MCLYFRWRLAGQHGALGGIANHVFCCCLIIFNGCFPFGEPVNEATRIIAKVPLQYLRQARQVSALTVRIVSTTEKAESFKAILVAHLADNLLRTSLRKHGKMVREKYT